MIRAWADWMKSFYDVGFTFLDAMMPRTQDAHASTRPSMSFESFAVENYKSIKHSVSVPLSDGGLVVLLGLNEMGKTTLLKAIESFDYRNDPESEPAAKRMFTGAKNKGDTYSNKAVKITATIKIVGGKIDATPLLKTINESGHLAQWDMTEEFVCDFIDAINRNGRIRISRVIPFKEGEPQPNFYQIDLQGIFNVDMPEEFVRLCALYIVSLCPYIVYFEDFQDTIPEKVFVSPESDAFKQDWLDIIEGLFYDTQKDLSVSKLQGLYAKDPDSTDVDTVLQKINNNLNKKFTKQWKNLSGVKDISGARLKYDHSGKYFQILIGDKDSAMYNITERSRGAVWYVSFLMKTEFRRKKMRAEVGRLVYLIDEPASNLHPTAQGNMLTDFARLAKDAFVVYATHSRYLVSLDNIKTTYIVSKMRGKLSCDRIGDYWQKPGRKSVYYQPIADCLDIRPHSLGMPCDKAVIVEGPSDMTVITVMYEMVTGSSPNFTIYPAGGARDMGHLISLNLGWGARIKILLDSDQDGNLAKCSYMEKFDLQESNFVQWPDGDKELEKVFDPEEIAALWSKIYREKKESLTKKEFAVLFARMRSDDAAISYARKIIGKATVKKFKGIFEGSFSDFSK